jgi:heat-inducible transcriptional repressor
MSAAPNDRKKRVLQAIVREYIESAEPVGSGTIVIKYDFDVSPATIRNDMAELESEGLLEQPHTSAGRVPTERGYRFYVEELSGQTELPESERQQLAGFASGIGADRGRAFKELAKAVADLADQTVVLSLGPGQTFVAGVSNLFRKPEFREAELLREVSRIFDDLDSVLDDLRSHLNEDVQVFIGGENPFGEDLSSVVARLGSPEAGGGLFGIFGPQRMDYDANVALMRYIREILSRPNI